MDWIKQSAVFIIFHGNVFPENKDRQTTKAHQSSLYWQGIHCCQRCFWLDSLPTWHWQYVDFSFAYLNLNQSQCSILWRLCE